MYSALITIWIAGLAALSKCQEPRAPFPCLPFVEALCGYQLELCGVGWPRFAQTAFLDPETALSRHLTGEGTQHMACRISHSLMLLPRACKVLRAIAGDFSLSRGALCSRLPGIAALECNIDQYPQEGWNYEPLMHCRSSG